MNYLKHFERYSDQIYDFIYSNFLEIADDYNFTKVDDVFKSGIQDTVYEINYSNFHNCYLIKIFFDKFLLSSLTSKFRKSLDNFLHSLIREDLEVKIDHFRGSLIMDIYIRDFKKNESKSFYDDFDQLKDIFLDLSYDGFDVKFYNEDQTKLGNPIYRIVIKSDNNYFDINDCLSVLKRSVEYMQGLGYNYNCGYMSERGGNRRFFVNQKGAFHMGHEITEKIYRIHVSFYL